MKGLRQQLCEAAHSVTHPGCDDPECFDGAFSDEDVVDAILAALGFDGSGSIRIAEDGTVHRLEVVAWLDEVDEPHNYGHDVAVEGERSYTHLNADRCHPLYRDMDEQEQPK